jgi:hypothetical protein
MDVLLKIKGLAARGDRQPTVPERRFTQNKRLADFQQEYITPENIVVVVREHGDPWVTIATE